MFELRVSQRVLCVLLKLGRSVGVGDGENNRNDGEKTNWLILRHFGTVNALVVQMEEEFSGNCF